VKINRIYFDRGFFDSKAIETLKRHHIKFIIPCSENPRIKKIIRFNVVIVKDEHGIKRAFATNIDFNENEPNLSERLFLLYSRRWSVETSYRMLKHSFWMKTTSKNYFIRLFYFLLSTFLYNTWLLSDILICFAVFGHMQETYIVTSKHFIAILFDVGPGG
jgi:IS4 transposase